MSHTSLNGLVRTLYILVIVNDRICNQYLTISISLPLIAGHSGSISAEHGLGISKNNFLHYSKSASMIELMKQFKKMLDPNGIMNPYKYLPDK